MRGSQLSISGILSLIQSALYIVAVAALTQTPMLDLLGHDVGSGMSVFATAHAANHWPVTVMCLSFVLLGLFGFAAVAPATAILLKEEEDGLLKLGKNLALICLGIIIVYYTWFLATVGARTELYNTGDAVTKTVIAAIYDAQEPSSWISWFMFGGTGLWVWVVGFAAYKTGIMPLGFVAVCWFKTCGFFIAHAGIVLGQVHMVVVGAIIGAIIGAPIYHIWIGIALRRAAKMQET